jgi:membrane protein DedA with SNARE-associated domain
MVDFWWYLWLAILSIVTEEAAPIAGGLREHAHPLRERAGACSISFGTWSADMLLYYLGRWRGHWVRHRWPRVREFMLRALKVVRRHPWRSSVAVRFAYGLRFTLPIACGAARVPLPIYALGAAVSAVTWSFLATGVGWAFGKTAKAVLGHVKHYEWYFFAVILLGVLFVLRAMQRRHVEDEVVEVLAAGDTKEMPVVPTSDQP